ncbi:MAG: fibronectin-binding protein A N-terminus-domain-containing protein [Piptocephalis tieghemiana]|nr:MAG: fibronectin-binding protein A N-terminus-domain-containing protein [Piptocephalis tieghemiana]
MKQRVTALDIAAIVRDIQPKLTGQRLQNVYNSFNKLFLFKFGQSEEKVMLLVESGIRLHTSQYLRDKAQIPSNFCSKLRKHLRNRRLTRIEQVGQDRVVRLSFHSDHPAIHTYHIILEFFAAGNVILLDESNRILALLRQKPGGSTPEWVPLPLGEVIRREADDLGQGEEEARRMEQLYHAMSTFANLHLLGPSSPSQPGYLILASPPSPGVPMKYESFHSFLPYGYTVDGPFATNDPSTSSITLGPLLIRLNTMDEAMDQFFSEAEGQKHEGKVQDRGKRVEKKVEAVRKDQYGRINRLSRAREDCEIKAQSIESSLAIVEKAIALVKSHVDHQGRSWKDIQRDLKGKKIGDVRSSGPKPTVSIDIHLDRTAYANARDYYSHRKIISTKEEKTRAMAEVAVARAEEKIHRDEKEKAASAAMGQTNDRKAGMKGRKVYWFEKFLWALTNEGFLCVGGKDAQQNELLVKRYLGKRDCYVHADLHGAATILVKGIVRKALKGEDQAGMMSVCQSKAWASKIPGTAYWVWGDQVSKTAPTGEYLGTGSFMIRGKRNFLPPVPLIYGYGLLWKAQPQLPTSEDTAFLRDLRMTPRLGERLGAAIPICAPWPALERYKYKVKLVPGTLKKGKACQSAQHALLSMAKQRDMEKELIKAIPDMEQISVMLSNSRVVWAGQEDQTARSGGGKGKGKRAPGGGKGKKK